MQRTLVLALVIALRAQAVEVRPAAKAAPPLGKARASAAQATGLADVISNIDEAQAAKAKDEKALTLKTATVRAPAKKLALVAKKRLPLDPPVSDDRVPALATQRAELYKSEDCKGNTTVFTSSANAFIKDFHPFIGDLHSVKLCGKGTFFYFDTPDMQTKATLGHITRCGPGVTTSTEECECGNVPQEVRRYVQSFTIQYC